jgi:2-acylglycerol O-acyltransferase 2
VITIFLTLSVTPLTYKPQRWFFKGPLFNIWREYFDYKIDISAITEDKTFNHDAKYLFAEFPHGSMPVAQIISASIMDQISGDRPSICGLGADAVFMFAGMRQFMSALGVHPANRSNITKILNNYKRVAIIPGGIAEIYLINDKTEQIYLKERKGFVKAAIQEGAAIVPTFFFGNSRLFTIVGGSGSTDSFLAKLSRSLKMSIIFFYGRFYLPIPFRRPLLMVLGKPIEVKQKDNPTIEEIDEVLEKLQESVTKLYYEKRPSWETRPFEIK